MIANDGRQSKWDMELQNVNYFRVYQLEVMENSTAEIKLITMHVCWLKDNIPAENKINLIHHQN